MKKALLTIALVATLGLVANAQPDGFFRNDGNGDNSTRTDISGTTPALPSGGVGAINRDQPAPLGSGLLVLTVLGGAYLLRKQEK
mgnify:CR=1 FL=1|jgi:hypothetical protein